MFRAALFRVIQIISRERDTEREEAAGRAERRKRVRTEIGKKGGAVC